MAAVRRLVERATDSLRYRRHLPREFGGAPIYVSPSAGLKFLFRGMDAVDPVVYSLVRNHVKPGNVVWDVGANVGLFAFAAASLTGPRGHVYAFEPDAWLVQLLRRSADAQPAASGGVDVMPVAVAAANGFRTFHVAARSRAASSLEGFGSTQAGGVRARQTVYCVALDEIAPGLRAPDVIKIDVEGAELEVLQGARGVIARHRPVVLCEVGSGHAAAAAALLRELGYRLFDAENAARGEISSAAWNTVALPA
jgi:FkbM family methyltransferase